MNSLTQLYAIDADTGAKIKLDLYATEPVKLTFTAENLTSIQSNTSTYSQTFRIPATASNDRFFRHYFNVNINDFDVTKRVACEIVTSLGFFIDGHIRLQKVYVNRNSDLIDYEILFLGELRDFASEVGDGFMNSLDLSEYNHELDLNTVETSWLADVTDPINPGLFGGDVIYPLVEYGYDFDDDGVVQSTMIKSGGYNAFTSSATPLQVTQLRPWIRAKVLVDKIFSLTGYTYQSTFMNTNLFRNLYVNATGNIATADASDLYATNLLAVTTPFQSIQSLNGLTQYWQWPIESRDVGNNWNGQEYVVPIDGTTTAYQFSLNIIGDTFWSVISGTGLWPDVTVEVNCYINGIPYKIAEADNGGTDPAVFFNCVKTLTFDGTTPVPGVPTTTLPQLLAGDRVEFGFRVIHPNGPPTLQFATQISANELRVINAPASVNLAILLSDKVKLIDFLRSILTKFRMVMVPDREVPKRFIIEPWNEWIATGQRLDWTHKVDGNKDIQFEPLFFSQSAIINFKDSEDTDYPNDDNQRIFKEAYGTRIFDANNELLDGERDITTQFAPTPVERVNGMSTGEFIIPKLAQLEPFSSDSGTTNQSTGLIKPIKAKPRLLFWNGMHPSTINWYLQTTTARTTFPQMTYLSQFAPASDTLNLNWEVEAGRWTTPPNGQLGEDVYTRYWQDYIESLYSPEARKMTAYFILDTEDLNVEFRDSIFIRDSWWRILKISDAPIEGINSVKVELIKLLNAPSDECECLEYYVTDNRVSPEAAYVFSYIDCDGELTAGSVFANTVTVCACDQVYVDEPDIVVTTTGQLCSIVPPNPIEVEFEWQNDSLGSGICLVEDSSDLAVWTTRATIPIPTESTGSLTVNTESDKFLRISYTTTAGESQTSQVTFTKNGNTINGETFVATPVPTYVNCIERLDSTSTYSIQFETQLV